MFDFDTSEVREGVSTDPAFRLSARYWNARIGLDMETECYELHVCDGEVVEFTRLPALDEACEVRISAPAASWDRLLRAVPPPGCVDPYFADPQRGFRIDGDFLGAIAPYYAAIQDFIAILRRVRSGPAPNRPVADVERRFDTAVGRYVYVRVDGVQYRVYFEEAGKGDIPMLLQHTAGADGRQWRHVLEDPDYQQRYRMIAYDLPYHGKSLPPPGERWWETEYRLSRDFLMKTVVAISHALELERPVYMGCSIGGHLAPDLALYHPDEFSAVIGINAGLATPVTATQAEAEHSWYHPRVASDWKAAVMWSSTAPTSPEAYRRETTWIYNQGAPPALAGDIFYYAYDHHLTAAQASQIDTSRVAVYLLTGEYDPLAAKDGTAELARHIVDCYFRVVPGLGHFGPSENPQDFKPALLPVLAAIAAKR